MAIYHMSGKPHTVHVAPGHKHKGVSDWTNPDGTDKVFLVKFQGPHAAADVDKKLADYLVAEGYAKRTRIVLPHIGF